MKLFSKVVVLLPVLASVVHGHSFRGVARAVAAAALGDDDLDEDSRDLRDWYFSDSVSQPPSNEERVEYGKDKFIHYATAFTDNLSADMKVATSKVNLLAPKVHCLRVLRKEHSVEKIEEAIDLLHVFDKLYNEHKPLVCGGDLERISDFPGEDPFEAAAMLIRAVDNRLESRRRHGRMSESLEQRQREFTALVNNKKWHSSRDASCSPYFSDEAAPLGPIPTPPPIIQMASAQNADEIMQIAIQLDKVQRGEIKPILPLRDYVDMVKESLKWILAFHTPPGPTAEWLQKIVALLEESHPSLTTATEDRIQKKLEKYQVLVKQFVPNLRDEPSQKKVEDSQDHFDGIAGKIMAAFLSSKEKLRDDQSQKKAENAPAQEWTMADYIELREKLKPIIYFDLAINVILVVVLAAIYILQDRNNIKTAVVNFLNIPHRIEVCKQALQTTKDKISQKIPASWWPNKDTCRMPTIKSEGKVVLIEYALISILMACTLILAEFDKWAFVLWGLFALFVALQLRFQSSVNPHTAGRDTTKPPSNLPDIARFFSWAALRDYSIALFHGARAKAHKPLFKFGIMASVIAVVFPGVWLLFFVVYISIVCKLVLHHKHEKFGKIAVKADRPGDNEVIDDCSESNTTMTQDQPTTAQQPSDAYPAMNNSTFPQDTTMTNASEKISDAHNKGSAVEAHIDKEIKKEALLHEQHQQELEAQEAQKERTQAQNEVREKGSSEDEWEMVERPE